MTALSTYTMIKAAPATRQPASEALAKLHCYSTSRHSRRQSYPGTDLENSLKVAAQSSYFTEEQLTSCNPDRPCLCFPSISFQDEDDENRESFTSLVDSSLVSAVRTGQHVMVRSKTIRTPITELYNQ